MASPASAVAVAGAAPTHCIVAGVIAAGITYMYTCKNKPALLFDPSSGLEKHPGSTLAVSTVVGVLAGCLVSTLQMGSAGLESALAATAMTARASTTDGHRGAGGASSRQVISQDVINASRAMADGSYSKPRPQNQGGSTTARAHASTVADPYQANNGDEYEEDYEEEQEEGFYEDGDDDDDDQVSYNGPLGDIVEQAIDDQQ